eukprot:5552443-Alexandrium_andersonii.AAC.1
MRWQSVAHQVRCCAGLWVATAQSLALQAECTCPASEQFQCGGAPFLGRRVWARQAYSCGSRQLRCTPYAVSTDGIASIRIGGMR